MCLCVRVEKSEKKIQTNTVSILPCFAAYVSCGHRCIFSLCFSVSRSLVCFCLPACHTNSLALSPSFSIIFVSVSRTPLKYSFVVFNFNFRFCSNTRNKTKNIVITGDVFLLIVNGIDDGILFKSCYVAQSLFAYRFFFLWLGRVLFFSWSKFKCRTAETCLVEAS